MNRKGIVMESGGKWAILLMQNGEYKKVKTGRRLCEGELYTVPVIRTYKPLAGVAVLIIMLTFSVNFFPVVAYASFSSGVDLGVNRWGQIVYAKVSTSEGEKLVEGLGLWGRSIDAVFPEILDRIVTLQEESNNSYEIEIDIKSADENDQDNQVAVDKINRIVSLHSNPKAAGRWNHKYNDNKWEWESDHKKTDSKKNQNTKSDAESGYKAKDKIEQNHGKSEEMNPEESKKNEPGKERKKIIRSPSGSGPADESHGNHDRNPAEKDGNSDKNSGYGHDKDDSKREKEKDNHDDKPSRADRRNR